MKADIAPIVEALLLLLGAIITTFVIPWITSKTTTERLSRLSALVTIGVEAAEQIYTGSGMGAEKKAYVLDFLESRGVTVDFDIIDNMIEAAVFNLPHTEKGLSTETIGFSVDENDK